MNQKQQQAAISELLTIVKPGDTIYTILRSVSRSGMSRTLDLYAIKDGKPLCLTAYAAAICGYSRTSGARWSLKVKGCGMDMGFDVVYNLGAALWPKGDGKYTRNRNGNKGPETDGGYMLRQEWI